MYRLLGKLKCHLCDSLLYCNRTPFLTRNFKNQISIKTFNICLVIVVVTVVTRREMVKLVVVAVRCVQMVKIVVKTKLEEETKRTCLQRQSRPPKSPPLLQERPEQNSCKRLKIWILEELLLRERLQVRTQLSSPRCLSSPGLERIFSPVQATRPCDFLCGSSYSPASSRPSIVDT